MMKKMIIAVLIVLETFHVFSQQPTEKENRMQWFEDAKLGIFIHWGIYAVNGIDERWSFYNGYISHEEYMYQLNGFTAKNYNPAEWAKLIKTSGAKYTVLTTKHHDALHFGIQNAAI